MNYQLLKDKQRTIREGFSEGLALRVHRALSWLHKSEQCDDDLDAHFIFLWIAFNAAYSQELDHNRLSESQSFDLFLNKICQLNQDKKIDQLLWNEYSSSIRLLINNQFVFQPFWDFHNGKISQQEFESKFTAAKQTANRALANEDSPKLLMVILSRLYTLRNQLVHGGATWRSSANREQLRDAVNFLSKLVPIIIDTMMDNPNTLWGDACYPLVAG